MCKKKGVGGVTAVYLQLVSTCETLETAWKCPGKKFLPVHNFILNFYFNSSTNKKLNQNRVSNTELSVTDCGVPDTAKCFAYLV